MTTAPAPSFWSHPIAATRHCFTVRSTLQAVEQTFFFTLAPYYVYFWFQNDQFYLQIISSAFIVLINTTMILRIREKRLDAGIKLPALGIFAGLYVIWAVLFTDVVRT